jgi:hypothetical protein
LRPLQACGRIRHPRRPRQGVTQAFAEGETSGKAKEGAQEGANRRARALPGDHGAKEAKGRETDGPASRVRDRHGGGAAIALLGKSPAKAEAPAGLAPRRQGAAAERPRRRDAPANAKAGLGLALAAVNKSGRSPARGTDPPNLSPAPALLRTPNHSFKEHQPPR